MAEPGIGQLVGQLTGDVREVAKAEIGLRKAQALAVVDRYRGAVIFFAIAGLLALAALPALLVGLILLVATLIGPGWATLAVIGVTLAIAAVLAMIGKQRLTTAQVAS